VKCLKTWDCVSQFNTAELKTTTVGYAEAADSSEWNLPGFTAPFSKLYFVLDGSITAALLSADGTKTPVYTLTPGKVWLLPCGNRYDLSTEMGFRKYYLHVNLPSSAGIDVFSSVRQVWGVPFDMERWRFAGIGENGWAEPGLSFVLRVKALALDALARLTEGTDNPILARRLYEESRFPPEVVAAFAYIRENLSARLTVEEVAEACRIPVNRLRRLFRENVGTSPKAYLADRLYERAGELLLSRDRPVKETAAELKFSDLYAFSRFWKSRTGLSPTAYRALHR